MSNVIIRPSQESDIDDITAIYANEVLHGLASFEINPPDTKQMMERRRRIVQAGYPYLVATKDSLLAGYAYAGPYRSRPAYQYTVENSVYVAQKFRNMGIGTALLGNLIQTCEQGNWRTMIAVIGDKNNSNSIALHKSLGFNYIGTIEATGYKLDQWVDTVLMQRSLNLDPSLPVKTQYV